MNLNKYDKRYKRFLAIIREMNEIRETQKKLGFIELKKPIFLGWTTFLIPREDIQRRNDAQIYWEVIKACCRKGFIRDKTYLKRRKKKYQTFPYKPDIQPISEKVYLKLGISAKKHFVLSNHFTRKYHQKYYVCILPDFYWVLKLEKSYKTKIKVIDEILEQQYAEFHDEWINAVHKYYPGSYGKAKTYICKKMNRAARRKTKEMLHSYINTGELSDVFPFSGRNQAKWESW